MTVVSASVIVVVIVLASAVAWAEQYDMTSAVKLPQPVEHVREHRDSQSTLDVLVDCEAAADVTSVVSMVLEATLEVRSDE